MTLQEFLDEWNNGSDRLLVHTSGSTGEPKALWVEKRRMEASARITCDFLGLKAGDTALLCMPLDFIAGKMMVVRALVRGLRLISVEPSGRPFSVESGKWKVESGKLDFAAMVPLQVWNTVRVAEERERLMAVRHLIIGGGAIDDELARELRCFPNAVWSTYGMTETLSHIALRRLNGPEASEWYTPFEGVEVRTDADGCLVIDAPHVCAETLVTNDIAEVATTTGADGRPRVRFRIIGRRDNVICSGGVKIQIEEVERLLRPHLGSDFLITKRADKKFGEAVVLLYKKGERSEEELRAVCRRTLPKYWVPRFFVAADALPYTATGKPARKEAELLVQGV
jgi:O-succinylbenzoic acid--CoA ligase